MRGVFYLIRPLSGVSCLSFYRPRGSRNYRWEKEEKLEAKKVLRRCRVFLFLCTADTADGGRDSSMLGVCPLIVIGPCSGFVSKWSHPILSRRVARRTRVLNHDPTGSRHHSDPASVAVDDVSFSWTVVVVVCFHQDPCRGQMPALITL